MQTALYNTEGIKGVLRRMSRTLIVLVVDLYYLFDIRAPYYNNIIIIRNNSCLHFYI